MESISDNEHKYKKVLIKVINKIKNKKILIELLSRFKNKKDIKNLFRSYKKGPELEVLLSKLFNKMDKNDVKNIINNKIKYIDEENDKMRKKIEKTEKILKFMKEYNIIDIALKNIKNNGYLTSFLSNVKDGQKIGPLLQEMTDKKSIDVLLNVINKVKKDKYQVVENGFFDDIGGAFNSVVNAINPLEIAKNILNAIPGFNFISRFIDGMIDIMKNLPSLIISVLESVIPAIINILPYIVDLFNYVTTKLYDKIQNIFTYIKNIIDNVKKYPIPTALSSAFFFIGPQLAVKYLIEFNVIPQIAYIVFAVICVLDLLLNDYYNVTVLKDDGTKEEMHIFKYIESLIEASFKYIFGGGFNIKNIINWLLENKITTIIVIIGSLIFVKQFITIISEYF
jgi:hypothetical protein